jgi:hypothetical protein
VAFAKKEPWASQHFSLISILRISSTPGEHMAVSTHGHKSSAASIIKIFPMRRHGRVDGHQRRHGVMLIASSHSRACRGQLLLPRFREESRVNHVSRRHGAGVRLEAKDVRTPAKHLHTAVGHANDPADYWRLRAAVDTAAASIRSGHRARKTAVMVKEICAKRKDEMTWQQRGARCLQQHRRN